MFHKAYMISKEFLNKLILFMPFDFAQESVRLTHHERNQRFTVCPESFVFAQEGLVEGLNQSFAR
jgi:hypothetical protein